MNRAANVFDAIPILTMLLVFGIAAIVTVMFTSAANTAIQSLPASFSVAQGIMSGANSTVPPMLDLWFICLFVGLPLVSAALAYFNNIHPFFFWLSIPVCLFTLIFGKALEGGWLAFIADPNIASVAAQLPATSFILGNYGFYSYFVFVIIAIGTYLRIGGQDTVGGLG